MTKKIINQIPTKIAYFTNAIPHYRQGLYDILFNSAEIELRVYAQKEIKGIKIKSIHEVYSTEQVTIVKHIDLWKNKLAWQFIPWRKVLKEYDVIIVDGNPRIVTHFILATLLRILNRKVILYSMLHSFRNNKVNEWIRIRWISLFRYHLLYNDDDLLKLKEKGINDVIAVAYNNGLNQDLIDEERRSWNDSRLRIWQNENIPFEKKSFDLVTIGRLTEGKYDILLEAIALVKDTYHGVSCCIIGEGTAQESLEKQVKVLSLESNVHFAGGIYLENELAPHFLSSKVFVHPTAIGLSIMHAFGYGVPAITHNKSEEHGPEFIALKENENGITYQDKNKYDLAKKIVYLMGNEHLRKEYAQNAEKLVREKYNTSVMANRFIKLVQLVKNDNKGEF